MKRNPHKIELDEATHTYFVDGKPVRSVSNMVRSLVPKFDADTAAQRVANRRGWKKEEVLVDWAKVRDDACLLGNRVHEFIKLKVQDKEAPGSWPPQCYRWLGWWNGVEQALTVESVEERIADLTLNIAGTPDALFRSGKTGLRHLADWKTNTELRVGNDYGEYLLKPFQDLPNCEFCTYSLQLNLYWLILERRGETNLGLPYIIYITEEAVIRYPVLDLRARLTKWLLP